MPGCTAPNCTNSSQKGFKLYHFPSDRERSSVWVHNLGRERGWTPTKHTCVCEVHFEESQFESHRADGLRKLKPNAVPTIFNKVAPLRTYTKRPKKKTKNNKFSSVAKENEICPAISDTEFNITSQQKETDEGESAKRNSDECIQGEDEGFKVLLNVSVPSQCVTDTKSSERGRKQGPPVSRHKRRKGVCEWNPEKSRTISGRKRGRPLGSGSSSRASLPSPVRKSVKVSLRDKDHLPDKGTVDEDCPASEDKTAEERGGEQIECFVCRKNVDNGVSMHTLTNTTKVYMHHKLDKIVRGEIELLIEEESVLCTRCASLLNYMDRIEVELNMLTKVILDCIYKKYGMGGVAVDKGHENLLPDVEQREQDCADNAMNLDLQQSLRDESSSQMRENEDGIRNGFPNDSAINEKCESSPLEEMRCRVCGFRTSYKSLMIFHLRQHLKPTYRCDFCDVDLPEGAISWVDDQSDITNIDLVDENGIVEMHDGVVRQENETNESGIKEVNDSDIITLPKSMDQIMSIMPVSIDKIISLEALEGPESTEDAGSLPDKNIVNSLSLHHVQSVSNVKHVSVLDGTGMIVMQDVGNDKESKDSEMFVSENPKDT
ncbi:THAP domain-containing protein 2 [Zootermopsis nevadensis]|uniref:THAP domain-containing protein 2 n=2 Tax=Zootermopsis nevadensis TaxID=136037 RepID=A0A067QZG8_ZOONE|nr:THAP domain-containing protein 2 [Zootermopsis nevadensis]